MPFDPERHHRRSIRAKGYDYSDGGTYFVTICTANREMLFGGVRYGAIALNEFGKIAQEEWERSAEIRKEIELEAFVVMPNHLHGLVTITPDAFVGAHAMRPPVEGTRPDTVGAHGMRPGSTSSSHTHDNQPAHHEGASLAPLQRSPRSLGSFIGGFKGATTRRINEVRGTTGTPVWQRNYYERIVRNEQMMSKIWTYIENNPLQWSLDRENPDRIREDPIEAWIFGNSRTQRIRRGAWHAPWHRNAPLRFHPPSLSYCDRSHQDNAGKNPSLSKLVKV